MLKKTSCLALGVAVVFEKSFTFGVKTWIRTNHRDSRIHFRVKFYELKKAIQLVRGVRETRSRQSRHATLADRMNIWRNCT